MSEIWDLPDVAKHLKVHPSTIYRFLKQHNLPAFKVGRDWKFRKADIERWEEERIQNGTPSR